ncbi:membrane metallo-endopeptidase-like 1 [Drosophila kikkawai]|uniref:Membrane metallo-endopeptidase-like 1 n=1 Tax=Drosophila kikkawai TaxID=30033 RepID=A0ABM4GR32_DROKI
MKTIGCLLVLLGFAAGSTLTRAPDSSVNHQILDYIQQHMNISADPCENFHNFASGRFQAVHQRDDCYSIHGAVEHKYNTRLQTLFELLKDRIFDEEKPSIEEKVWRYYNACLTTSEESRSEKHYLELVPPDEDLTWPQFAPKGTDWPQKPFRWLHTLAHLRRFGMENSLIRMNVQPNVKKNSSKFQLVLDKPDVERFEDVSSIHLLLLSLGVDKKKAPHMASRLIQLDSDLHTLAEEYDESRLDCTLAEVQNRTGLQLNTYLEILFNRSLNAGLLPVEVGNMEYLESLEEFLGTYHQQVVVSYLMVQFVRFVKGLDGSASADSFKCTTAVRSQLELASDFLYQEHYLGQERLQKSTAEVQQIFKAVKGAFEVRLEQNHLQLTTDEISALKQKLQAMTLTVGLLPTNIDQRRFVTDFYGDLKLDRNQDTDFPRAQLKALELRTRRVLVQLNGAEIKGSGFFLLTDSLPETNPEPQFQVSGNTVVLPYDFLQEPFFAPESHDVFKVSLLGYMMARQIMLSFKPHFLPFDANGYYGEVLNSFDERSSYVEAISCLNRTSTYDLEQRLIDVEGLGLIYDVYFGQNSEFEQKQPDFTELPLKKLFLLSFAQMFVGDEEFIVYSEVDSDKLRLSQALSHLPAFGEIFSCSPASLLNPADECRVW